MKALYSTEGECQKKAFLAREGSLIENIEFQIMLFQVVFQRAASVKTRSGPSVFFLAITKDYTILGKFVNNGLIIT